MLHFVIAVVVAAVVVAVIVVRLDVVPAAGVFVGQGCESCFCFHHR